MILAWASPFNKEAILNDTTNDTALLFWHFPEDKITDRSDYVITDNVFSSWQNSVTRTQCGTTLA